MTVLVLDAGALIALERGDREMVKAVEDTSKSRASGRYKLVIPAGALCQVWRDGSRQARIAWALKVSDVFALSERVARSSGELCGRAGTNDVIDASVAVTAALFMKDNEVQVLTSDHHDIHFLMTHIDADNCSPRRSWTVHEV